MPNSTKYSSQSGPARVNNLSGNQEESHQSELDTLESSIPKHGTKKDEQGALSTKNKQLLHNYTKLIDFKELFIAIIILSSILYRLKI